MTRSVFSSIAKLRKSFGFQRSFAGRLPASPGLLVLCEQPRTNLIALAKITSAVEASPHAAFNSGGPCARLLSINAITPSLQTRGTAVSSTHLAIVAHGLGFSLSAVLGAFTDFGNFF
jgi:hypothetical protein